MSTPTRTRLAPAARREQLLALGAELLATRTLDDLTVDLLAAEAGVSRGLLYHYFGSLDGYRTAVVRHAVDELVARTAPPDDGEPMERLRVSTAAYVDYVAANESGYRSLVRAAAAGTDRMRAIYEEARDTLVGRIFDDPGDTGVDAASSLHRLAVRGWAALVEELTLTWIDAPDGVEREQLVDLLVDSLPLIVVAATPQSGVGTD